MLQSCMYIYIYIYISIYTHIYTHILIMAFSLIKECTSLELRGVLSLWDSLEHLHRTPYGSRIAP